MSSGSFTNIIYQMLLRIIYLIYIYKENLALNNQQLLICNKIKSIQTISSFFCFVFWIILLISILKIYFSQGAPILAVLY